MSDDLAPPRVLAAELRRAVGLLDELRDELTTAQSHLTHALDDAATHRTRAEAAEAEVARLRAEAAVLIAERDDARLTSRCNHGNWRGALAELDAQRATIEGRTVAPTDAEIAAHAAAGGLWRTNWNDRIDARLAHGLRQDDVSSYVVGGRQPSRWWALDASGRPCVWPTPALDAAGEGR